MIDRFADWVPEGREGRNWNLNTVISTDNDLRDPVIGRHRDGRLVVAATSSGSPPQILVSQSIDGSRWKPPRVIATAKRLPRLSVMALSSLSSGRCVLAGCEWQQTTGQVEKTGEQPPGVFRYRWTGFRVQRNLLIWTSDDVTDWTAATISDVGPFVAAAPCGKIIEADGQAWLMVYGPTNQREMDAALSAVGWFHSTDGGDSWRFSHLLAAADAERNMGFGPGDTVTLEDGRWLALLQCNMRALGDYPRPRICRTISTDAGRSWATQEPTLLGPSPKLVALGGQSIMYGSQHDSGIFYGVSHNAGRSWAYQNYIFEVIFYNKNPRGSLSLQRVDDDSVYAVFHWMKTQNTKIAEIKGSFIRRKPS